MCDECRALQAQLYDIETLIHRTINTAKERLEQQAKRNEDYTDVLNCPVEELPKKINDPSPLIRSVVADRLAGRPTNTPVILKDALGEIEFDYEDYMRMGLHNGRLYQAIALARLLKKEDLVTSAQELIYGDWE